MMSGTPQKEEPTKPAAEVQEQQEESDQKLMGSKNVKSNSFVAIYANNATFAMGFWDIRIAFGEIQGIENNQVIVEDRVSVTMPFAMAKAMARVIMLNIKAHEQRTGWGGPLG